MRPVIRADHFSAEIILGSYRIKVPGTVGKKETKNLAHRVRNRLFNESLAKVWLRETEAGRTLFHGALRAFTENKK
jgi:hypothetical protein